jgi:cyanate lyase
MIVETQTRLLTKQAMTAAIVAAKARTGLSWTDIAARVGKAPVWVTSACLGMNSMPAADAVKTGEALGLEPEVVAALQECPNKVFAQTVPTDPLMYRLYEIVGVYGETIKALVHESFGDGIMSAIDFSMHIEKVEDPKGDRVKVTMNGKFLPYKTW